MTNHNNLLVCFLGIPNEKKKNGTSLLILFSMKDPEHFFMKISSMYFLKKKIVYHKVASSGLSRLIAQPHFQNVNEGEI